MKKLLFILLFLPFIAFGQAVVQQSKTPPSGSNGGNQYFQWYSGSFNGYFIPPYGSNATLNRGADINGLFYVQLSDSSIRFRYNGSWIPLGKAGSSGAIYFSGQYFGGTGTSGNPLTVHNSDSLFHHPYTFYAQLPTTQTFTGKNTFNDTVKIATGKVIQFNAVSGAPMLIGENTITGGGSGDLSFTNLPDGMEFLSTNYQFQDNAGANLLLLGNGSSAPLSFAPHLQVYKAPSLPYDVMNKRSADSLYAAIGSGGTVASITPGYGFTSSTPITTSGTMTVDTTKLQTVLNFFPKGDTRYAKITSIPTAANPTATAGVTAVNGSATTFMRSDAAPKVDSTVFRTVANSYTLAALQTKFNGYVPTATTVAGFALSSNVTLATETYSTGLVAGSYNGSTAATLKADTTVLQTVLNFFPKGDTRYAKIGGGTLTNTLTFGTGLISGSFNNSTSVTEKVDTTVVQTVLNFFPKGDTRYLKTSTAGTTYVPYSGATGNVTLGSNTITAAQFLSGTLGYTDTGILGALQSSINGYNQLIIQNSSTGTSASANLIVNNSASTATTNYGELGINGVNFSNGSGSLNQPGYVYFDAVTYDIVVGTFTNNSIHFVTNNAATDAMNISGSGTISIPAFSTAGVVHNAVTTGALSSSLIVQGDVTNGYVDLSSAQASIAGNKGFTGKTTFNPSISASANLAQASIFTPTLTAVANNDVLVAGDFNPTIAGVGIINTLGSVTGGSAYTAGTYTSVPLTGGNGTGAVATVVVVGTAVSTVTITTAGTRYVVGDVLSAAAANIGGTGSGFSVPVATLTQTVTGAPIRATVSNIGVGSGIAGSWSDGVLLANPTTATSTLSQNAPSIHFQSQGYNTGSSASQTVDGYIVGAGQSGATTPGTNIAFLFYQNGTKSGTTYAFSPSLATFTSAQLQLTHSSQGATVFTSLELVNVTPSTSGTPNQWTNQFFTEGTVWNTGGTPANNPFAFGLIGEGTSSANPYGTLYFQTYLGTSNTPTFVNTASLTTQGQLGLGLSNTNIQAGSTSGSIFNVAPVTLTDNSTASGTVTNFAGTAFGQTTLAATNASITYTNGYTVYIANAPTNGTNVTMTNKYAFGVAAGASTFGGTINNITLTAPASASTLTIASGSSFITSGAFSTTITSTATTNATLPSGTGTLAYLAGTNTWTGVNTMILKNFEAKASPTAVNASATLTAAQVQSSITTSSTTAVAFTMPTATLLATQVGAAQGTTIQFTIDNSASTSSGAITLTLGSGMTSGLNAGLTISIGKVATYIITFTSTTTCVMSQIL